MSLKCSPTLYINVIWYKEWELEKYMVESWCIGYILLMRVNSRVYVDVMPSLWKFGDCNVNLWNDSLIEKAMLL